MGEGSNASFMKLSLKVSNAVSPKCNVGCISRREFIQENCFLVLYFYFSLCVLGILQLDHHPKQNLTIHKLCPNKQKYY